jgi:hypothetical protein
LYPTGGPTHPGSAAQVAPRHLVEVGEGARAVAAPVAHADHGARHDLHARLRDRRGNARHDVLGDLVAGAAVGLDLLVHRDRFAEADLGLGDALGFGGDLDPAGIGRRQRGDLLPLLDRLDGLGLAGVLCDGDLDRRLRSKLPSGAAGSSPAEPPAIITARYCPRTRNACRMDTTQLVSATATSGQNSAVRQKAATRMGGTA